MDILEKQLPDLVQPQLSAPSHGKIDARQKELGKGSSGLILQGLVSEQLAVLAALTLTGPLVTLISAVLCEAAQLYLCVGP